MKKCKITFLDEVHAKVEGLDIVSINKCIDRLKFFVPYRFHVASYKLGRWDGSIRFFDKNGKTYINLLNDIIPFLLEQNYEFEFEDRRKNLDFELSDLKIDKNIFADCSWPEGHILEGKPIQLRDDQVEAANYFADNRYGLQILATGFGKCLGENTLLKTHDKNFNITENTIKEFIDFAMTLNFSIKAENMQYDKGYSFNVDSFKHFISVGGEARQILGAIKKRSDCYKFVFEDGHEIIVSTDHTFYCDSLPVKASKVFECGYVDNVYKGKLHIQQVTLLPEQDVYDIHVAYPNLYIDAHGIYHHNTILTAAICKMVEDYGNTLTIVPSKSLVEQTADDLRLVNLDVGVYYSDKKELGHRHTVLTWQSMNEIIKQSKKDPTNLNIIKNDLIQVLVDECFDGDTLVKTPNGNKKIKNIQEGDVILNYCEKTKTIKEDIVIKKHVNLMNSSSENMLKLTFDNGIVIKVTANHKFFTDKGWVRADQLTEDMEIIDIKNILI